MTKIMPASIGSAYNRKIRAFAWECARMSPLIRTHENILNKLLEP